MANTGPKNNQAEQLTEELTGLVASRAGWFITSPRSGETKFKEGKRYPLAEDTTPAPGESKKKKPHHLVKLKAVESHKVKV